MLFYKNDEEISSIRTQVYFFDPNFRNYIFPVILSL